MNTEAENNEGNGFLKLLQEHSKGQVILDGSRDLAKVVAAVMETGKKGELTVKLKFEPVKNSDGQQMVVSHEVTPKIPKPTRHSSIFFTTDDAGLSRVPQNQVDWIEQQREREEASRAARQNADAASAAQG